MLFRFCTAAMIAPVNSLWLYQTGHPSQCDGNKESEQYNFLEDCKKGGEVVKLLPNGSMEVVNGTYTMIDAYTRLSCNSTHLIMESYDINTCDGNIRYTIGTALCDLDNNISTKCEAPPAYVDIELFNDSACLQDVDPVVFASSQSYPKKFEMSWKGCSERLRRDLTSSSLALNAWDGTNITYTEYSLNDTTCSNPIATRIMPVGICHPNSFGFFEKYTLYLDSTSDSAIGDCANCIAPGSPDALTGIKSNTSGRRPDALTGNESRINNNLRSGAYIGLDVFSIMLFLVTFLLA